MAMESSSLAAKRRAVFSRWRLWALVPVLLLVGTVSLFAATGGSLIELVGRAPPPADEFDIRRVEFKPGEIRIRVTNPQREELTIAAVAVDAAIVPYSIEGEETLERLRSATIVVPFDWVEGDPISVGVTSSTGIETTEEIPAAVETPGPSAEGFFGYAVIGFLVGIVPVTLGLLWLPSLRRAAPEWLAAFMALTGGLALATLIATGIGLHNLGEGLAIGSSFALGELTLGTFLIVGFMVHNVTEGLGIATPIAEGRRAASLGRLAALTLVAGGPAILGAWLGGFVTSDVLGVVFFA